MNWTKMVLVSALAVILAIAHPDRCHAQQVALKTNLLYDATLTPNLGLEMGVGSTQSSFFMVLTPGSSVTARIGSMPSIGS